MIDIGVNIQHDFYLNDFDHFTQTHYAAGVSKLICISSDLEETQKNHRLCHDHSHLYYTAGVHPHHAKSWNDQTAAQLQHLLGQQCVAIGETGLDFDRNYSTPEEQIHAFGEQLTLANALDMPVYLHERDAFAPLTSMVQSANVRGVIHCFTGNKQQLAAYLDLGLYVGITGWLLDERRNQDLVEAMAFLPADRILLETDAPYLTPRNIRPRPKRNHPAFLPHIAEAIAKLKEISSRELITQTNENAKQLFGC